MHIFLLDLTSYINYKNGMDWHRRPEAISNYQSNKMDLFLICRNQKGISCMAEGKFSIDFSNEPCFIKKEIFLASSPIPEKGVSLLLNPAILWKISIKECKRSHLCECDVAYSLNIIRYFFVYVSSV